MRHTIYHHDDLSRLVRKTTYGPVEERKPGERERGKGYHPHQEGQS